MNDNVHVTLENLKDTVLPILQTIVRKNHDYGDAWQRFSIFTPLVRLNDKLLRVKTLSDGVKALVVDESIKDTLVDIVAYGILALLRLHWEETGMQYDKVDFVQSELPLINPEIIIQSLDNNEAES